MNEQISLPAGYTPNKHITQEEGFYEYQLERFWQKVNKNGSIPEHCPELGKCWEWILPAETGGYGTCRWNLKKRPAHRVSWEIHFGEIPEGMRVMHKCDNRKCIRDSHLKIGTAKDNSDDMIAKGRRYQIRGHECWARKFPERVRGSKNPAAKLNERRVKIIKRLLVAGMPQLHIARLFQLSTGTIGFIKSGKNWSHVILD